MLIFLSITVPTGQSIVGIACVSPASIVLPEQTAFMSILTS